MSLCENCKSLDICAVAAPSKESCFFFAPTEDFRIKNSKEYAIGYEQGRADAIDELLNNVSESIIWDVLAEIMKRNIGASEGTDKIIDYLQKVAEQLKGQRND